MIKPKLPYTVVLLLLGVALGVGSRSVPGLERYLTSHISDADPHIILFVFLPVLIFESAFAMEYHTFKKSFFQVIILALPGLGKYSETSVGSLKLYKHFYNITIFRN